MTQRLLIIIGLLCLFSVAQAQEENNETLELFDENEIFSLDVVEIERQPAYGYFNSNRIIYLFQDAAWQFFEYPVAVSEMNYVAEFPNNHLIFFGNDTQNESLTILLDRSTGELSEATLPCGFLNEWDQLTWMYLLENTGLCHYATQTVYPIPDIILDTHPDFLSDDNYCVMNRSSTPVGSPGGIVYLPICTDNNGAYLYSFNPTDETFDLVFESEAYHSMYAGAWVGENKLLLNFPESDTSGVTTISLYVFDVITREIDQIFDNHNILNYQFYPRNTGASGFVVFWTVSDNIITLNQFAFETGLSTFEINCEAIELNCADYLAIDFVSWNGEFVIIRTERGSLNAFNDGIRYLISTTTNELIFPPVANDRYISTFAYVMNDQLFWAEPRSDDAFNRNLHIVPLGDSDTQIQRVVSYESVSPDSRYVASWVDSLRRNIRLQDLSTGTREIVMNVPENVSATISGFTSDNFLVVNLLVDEPEQHILATWHVRLIEAQP